MYYGLWYPSCHFSPRWYPWYFHIIAHAKLAMDQHYNSNNLRRKVELPWKDTTACVLIKTGASQNDSGYLTVHINILDHDSITLPSTYYNPNEVVMNECYTRLVNVQLHNEGDEQNDDENTSWKGTIDASIENLPYYPMICEDGCVASSHGDGEGHDGSISGEYIVVDKNESGMGSSSMNEMETGEVTQCLNGKDGNVCTFIIPNTGEDKLDW